jgi:hypothetical protein
MKTQSIKTIKTFLSKYSAIEYLIKIGYEKNAYKIEKELLKNGLIKYGSILIIYDKYNLLKD